MTGGEDTGTDAEIIRDSLADPAAFGPIFDRHVDAVHGYLIRRGGRDLADELTGEIFEVALTRRHRFDLDRDSARPWLYGIAANVVRRHRRTGGRRKAAYLRLQARDDTSAVADLDDVDAAVDAAHQASALAAALNALAHRDREPLLLHVWEGLTYTEIAEALDIPLGTVRSRLNRARRRLRAAMVRSAAGCTRVRSPLATQGGEPG